MFSIAETEVSKPRLDDFACVVPQILLVRIILAGARIPAVDEIHLSELHPANRPVHISLVAPRGKASVIGVGRVSPISGGATGPPFPVDLCREVGSNQHAWTDIAGVNRAAGLEGARRVGPGFDSPKVLVTGNDRRPLCLPDRVMLPGPVAFQGVAGIFHAGTTKHGVHGQALVGVWIISFIIAGRFPVGQVVRHPRSDLRRIKGRQHGVVPCDEVNALVVTDVHLRRRRDLFHIAHAGGLKRLGLRLGQGGQEQGRQDGNDCDYHQQFNQGEGSSEAGVGSFHGLIVYVRGKGLVTHM